jgi:hypothetical protein
MWLCLVSTISTFMRLGGWYDRGANGEVKVIKRDKAGNIDRRHLGRWCRYVCKPPHPILHGREPISAFGLELAKMYRERREAAWILFEVAADKHLD